MPKTVTPLEARQRMDSGSAVLIDIREPAEHARENIPGARSLPLSQIQRRDARAEFGNAPCAILHCQGGNRTAANAAALEQLGFGETLLLEGGLNAWKSAGLPTKLDRAQPIELQRQVQIAAGSLVLLGVILAALFSPWLILLSAFVGAGLVFAGVSGWCGMAKLLAAMPWNRVTAR